MRVGGAMPRPVIVCPTAAGGHMDHAMDLALSAVDQGYPRPVIISRPGSRDYVPRAVHEVVDVVEALPPLADDDLGQFRRLIVMFLLLAREHVAIWNLRRRLVGPTTLIFQEPRYPWPNLLSLGAAGSSCTLILHNAVEHAGAAVSLGSRLQAWIRSGCLRRATRVATFGAEQARIARNSTPRPVRSFVLPRSTRIVHDCDGGSESTASNFPGLICIGELRPNKGIEVAIEAAGRQGETLHVVGRKVEDEYFELLVNLAQKYDSVTVTGQFLSAAEFDQAVAAAECVLLPYVQFDAQSGVLAKASAFGVSMIISDLPSLREQIRPDDNAIMVTPGSVDDLALAIKEFRDRGGVVGRQSIPDLEEWDQLVQACVEGW